jgi:uncharacterized protein YceK
VQKLILLLAIVGMGGCASTDSTSNGANADTAEGPKTRLVCHREQTTGSRTKGARICKEVPVD